jgi:heptosyltransferase-2
MKIILIRFSSLGDCILLCPLAAHMKASGAEEVTVVTKSAYAEIFAAATGVDRVVAFEPRGGLPGLLRIAGEYRGRGYRVIDAHNNWRSRILSRQLGGAHARLAKNYGRRLGLIVLKRRTTLPTMLQQYGMLAAAVGMRSPRLLPGGIEIPEPLASAAEERMRHDSHPYMAVAPGARWPDKRWPLEHYTELARRLVRAHGYRLLLLGDAYDCSAASAIASENGEMCIDLTGRTGLMEGAAHLGRCAGFVGNDSGLAHLAEAVGVPALVLFGPTVEPFGYYPSLPGSKSIERDLACRPCSRNGGRPCPKRTRECLASIDVDTVETAALDMLSHTGPARYVLTS